jgi:hypothetical protein
MTLKEKLCQPFGGLKTETVNELEVIADDFASGFANWTWDKILITINDIDLFEYRFNIYSGKELLKMYKKEKGL